MFSVVAAPAKLTVVAVVFNSAKVVEPVVSEVVIAGDVPKTATPLPVSSEIALARLADEGVAKNVNTPDPGTVTESVPSPPLVVTNPLLVRLPSFLLVRDSLPARLARVVVPAGRVADVVPIETRVTEFAPLVNRDKLFARVSVPVVVLTVRPL